jgi:predicted CoA-binding protein
MADLRAVLERARTVAVVGISSDPAKPSHRVPRQLQAAGFRIIPVHPSAEELLGEQAYHRLAAAIDRSAGKHVRGQLSLWPEDPTLFDDAG